MPSVPAGHKLKPMHFTFLFCIHVDHWYRLQSDGSVVATVHDLHASCSCCSCLFIIDFSDWQLPGTPVWGSKLDYKKKKKKKKSSKPRGHNSASTMCSAPACVRCDPPDSAPGGTDLTYSGHLRDPLLFFNAASHFSTLNINWKSPSSAWMLFSEIVVTSW